MSSFYFFSLCLPQIHVKNVFVFFVSRFFRFSYEVDANTLVYFFIFDLLFQVLLPFTVYCLALNPIPVSCHLIYS